MLMPEENLSSSYGYLPRGEKRQQKFSIPYHPRKPPNTTLSLRPRSLPHSLPRRIFRGNANSGSPTSSLKLAIYRIDDVEGKWMYVCGKIEATP